MTLTDIDGVSEKDGLKMIRCYLYKRQIADTKNITCILLTDSRALKVLEMQCICKRWLVFSARTSDRNKSRRENIVTWLFMFTVVTPETVKQSLYPVIFN